jgi:GT2 family glycosyltransferase
VNIPLTVTVIICAYTERRWSDIVAAVSSLGRQTRQPDEVLLVIDHNPALAARARAEIVGARVVENDCPQGLSGARNAGVAHSCSDILAFLDDDAQADADWLEQLLKPYRDAAVVAVGGAATPLWPNGKHRPGWLPAMGPHGPLDWVVGCTYTGLPTGRAEVRNVMGCSMSFRSTAFDRVGGFSTGLGRVGTLPLGCEETEFCIRLRQQIPGARVLFEPRASVSHRVTPDRMTWSYLWRRSWSEGVSKAAIARIIGAKDALSTERRYVVRVLPAALTRALGGALTGRAGAAANATAIASAVAATVGGYLRERARSVAGQEDSAATFLADIDLRRPPPSISPVHPVPGMRYGEAMVLVRDGRWTAGITRLPIISGMVSYASVLAAPPAYSRPEPSTWTPAVSIVVPTADRPSAVRRCVKSLLSNEYPDLEIIVVNNRPAALSAATVLSMAVEDDRIQYVTEERPGVSRARNSGLAAATGELVGFVDDDIEVDAWWLRNLVTELADRNVDCATSLVLPGSLDSAPQRVFEELKGFGQGARRQSFGPDLAGSDPGYAFAPGRFGPGGCALWRATSVRALGGFDPLLGPGTASRAGEDLELFVRLARARGTIAYTPHALAWHEHGATWPELHDRLRSYGIGLTAMLTRHLIRHPADAFAVAAMVPRRLRAVVSRCDTGSSATRGTRPVRLLVDQVSGLAYGPFALARSAWRDATRREKTP